MKNKIIIYFALLFAFLNGAVYIYTEVNAQQRVQMVLDRNLKNLQTHYELLLKEQESTASIIYQYTIASERFIEIMSEVQNATKAEKVRLRDELKKLLFSKYEIIKQKGVLQYQFLLPNNESFLRMHKPERFGDDLTDVRDDFKYVNKTKNPIRGFVEGRTVHGFRNAFPLFGKNGEHLGAMEVSFSSDDFQHYLNNVSHIHTHFLVKKTIFDSKVWKRDDIILKYHQSSENSDYMLALEGIHTKDECIVENKIKLESVRDKLDSKMLQGDAFSVYAKHHEHVGVFSFLPIRSLKNETVAWLVAYEKSHFIQSTNKNMLLMRALTLLFSLILIYFILQQIRSKESILALKERMELAITGSNDGIWDWNLLDNTVYFSPRWKEMLGYSDSELPNEFSTWENHVHPDDLEPTKTGIQENIDGKTDHYEGVHRLKHKDGHWVWILDRGKALYNEQGKAIRMIGTHTDISEDHATQEKLQRFQTILENAPITIVITDLDGLIEYVNPWFTKTTGYTSQEAIGKNPRILKSDYHLAEDYTELWDVITQGKAWSGVFENVNKNGDHYWESAIIAPVLNDKGKVVNFVGIKEEITKEIYLQQQLDEKEEMMIAQSRHAAMGEMISMIAHQWRQPITIVSMVANNLLASIELDDLQPDVLKDSAEKLLKQTHHLSKTIDDFKNFFQPDREKEQVTIAAVLEDTQEVVGLSLMNNNIKLIIENDNETAILIHKRELMQVFINLINNAKDALIANVEDKHREIKISINEGTDDMLIKVCDNGGGIDASIIKKIFDPYFTTKNQYNGTGLGLYMSKTIIEKHFHGKISAENDDEGACITVVLPK